MLCVNRPLEGLWLAASESLLPGFREPSLVKVKSGAHCIPRNRNEQADFLCVSLSWFPNCFVITSWNRHRWNRLFEARLFAQKESLNKKKKLKQITYIYEGSSSEDPAHSCAKRSESTRNELTWGEMETPPPTFGSIKCRVSLWTQSCCLRMRRWEEGGTANVFRCKPSAYSHIKSLSEAFRVTCHPVTLIIEISRSGALYVSDRENTDTWGLHILIFILATWEFRLVSNSIWKPPDWI